MEYRVTETEGERSTLTSPAVRVNLHVRGEAGAALVAGTVVASPAVGGHLARTTYRTVLGAHSRGKR